MLRCATDEESVRALCTRPGPVECPVAGAPGLGWRPRKAPSATPDHDKQFVVETDASDYAIGAILSQEHEGKLHPIAYWSATLTPTERNYTATEKELYAIVRAFGTWRHHLEGARHKILVISDHANLVHYTKKRKITRRTAR